MIIYGEHFLPKPSFVLFVIGLINIVLLYVSVTEGLRLVYKYQPEDFARSYHVQLDLMVAWYCLLLLTVLILNMFFSILNDFDEQFTCIDRTGCIVLFVITYITFFCNTLMAPYLAYEQGIYELFICGVPENKIFYKSIIKAWKKETQYFAKALNDTLLEEDMMFRDLYENSRFYRDAKEYRETVFEKRGSVHSTTLTRVSRSSRRDRDFLITLSSITTEIKNVMTDMAETIQNDENKHFESNMSDRSFNTDVRQQLFRFANCSPFIEEITDDECVWGGQLLHAAAISNVVLCISLLLFLVIRVSNYAVFTHMIEATKGLTMHPSTPTY